MSLYPALSKLDIKRPQEISSYEVSTFNHIDTLRVRYVRQKGSLLPIAKRFQFPRRPVAGPQNQPGRALETDMSPALAEVLDELTALLKNKEKKVKQAKDILNEMEELQEHINIRFRELKNDLKQLQD